MANSISIAFVNLRCLRELGSRATSAGSMGFFLPEFRFCLADGSPLEKFFREQLPMNPQERGEALLRSDEIAAQHLEAAQSVCSRSICLQVEANVGADGVP